MVGPPEDESYEMAQKHPTLNVTFAIAPGVKAAACLILHLFVIL